MNRLIALAAIFIASPVCAQQSETIDSPSFIAKQIAIRAVLEISACREAQCRKATAERISTSPIYKFGSIYAFCFDVVTGVLSTGQNPGALINDLVSKNGDQWGMRLLGEARKTRSWSTSEMVVYRAPLPGGDRAIERMKHTQMFRIGADVCGAGTYDGE